MEENLPNESTQPSESFNVPETQPQAGIILLDDAQAYLTEAGKWARFLGIVAVISSGLLGFLALFMGAIMSAMSRFPGMGASKLGGLLTVIYLPIAVLYLFVGLYLYKFGTRVRDGVTFGDATKVTDGLAKLKSLFKLLGITTIVVLVLYALFFIIMIVAGAALFSGFKPSYQ
ncbi:DUF5362 family protein [Mucilaginibacter antarcticus]|uniref:DUF5362 family protein n=1 Tax=Mucilaginibacter antarcticus TaxID=1855725 RepID=A0ABW5XLS8_9SPHI